MISSDSDGTARKGSPQPQTVLDTDVAAPARRYLLERVDEAAVVQLYADGFAALPRDEKVLIWHLYGAALAGRDIYYDQRHVHSLAMRDLLEAIVTHPAGIPEPVLAEIWRYTKLFWINTGPYNNLTARKFVMRLGEAELVDAAQRAVANGGRIRLAGGETAAHYVARLAPMFFDPAHQPMVTNKTPGRGGDIVRDSANNLYAGVSMADLDGVQERYPLNSRLVKQADGTIVEEPYRIGGKYGDELAAIARHLEAAVPYATPKFGAALRALVQWYRTGEEADREAFDIAWVRADDTPVDTMNGFIEVYMDARGIKGAWEGVVYYVNPAKTEKIRRLAADAQWFEDHLPIDPRYRKPTVQGVTATAIEVVVETGDAGPITPIGVNLPNDQRIREVHGSKSVSLANVIEAYEKATTDEYRHEFAWSDDEFDRARRWGALASELTTEIHEVLGHGSGRMADGITAQPQELLKEQYSALEETRADLVALYFVADPRLVELAIVPGEHQQDLVLAEYEAYSRNALVQLRRVREGTQIEEDHMRNRQAIVHWLMAHTAAIDVRSRDGRTFYVMRDARAFQAGVAELLREVQRIKSEGDYAAAKALFDVYGVHFDAALRDEVVARVDRLNLPSYTGFVMPSLTPVHDSDGSLRDVVITYPGDLATQMLEYSAARRASL